MNDIEDSGFIIINDELSNNKKSLMKLNLKKLRNKCQEYNLSTEGSKTQLINRIINYRI